MCRLFLICIAVGICFPAIGQDIRLKVWPGQAPTNNGIVTQEDNLEGGRVANVSEPELFVFLPSKETQTGAAVVICPGGGYQRLAMEHEGFGIARWLASNGIAGIVLKYRMPNGHHQVPAEDARRALRLVRWHAAEWGIHPSLVGIAGSSAGGHLAATVATRFDAGDPASADPIETLGCRPDFVLLLYPVISMKEELTHLGSRKNLLGEDLNPELSTLYSNELHVTPRTPPVFIVLADNDRTVIPRNSLLFYDALKTNKVAAEMHIFAGGGHGFGITKNHQPADQWPGMFLDWLKASGFLKKP